MSQEENQPVSFSTAGIRQAYTIRNGKTYFKFSGGREIEITNISPLLGEKIRQRYPAPAVPVQKIATADGADFLSEPNPNDPVYLEARQKWQEATENASRKMIIQLAVMPFLKLNDRDRAEVKAYRDYMRDFEEIELEPSDEYCFAAYSLIKSADDYQLLVQAVMNMSNPTEAAIVHSITETFSSDVQG